MLRFLILRGASLVQVGILHLVADQVLLSLSVLKVINVLRKVGLSRRVEGRESPRIASGGQKRVLL